MVRLSRDYAHAKCLWYFLGIDGSLYFDSISRWRWLVLDLTSTSTWHSFCHSCWYTWKSWNTCWDLWRQNPVNMVNHKSDKDSVYDVLHSTPTSTSVPTHHHIACNPPKDDFVKLNVDSSFIANPETSRFQSHLWLMWALALSGFSWNCNFSTNMHVGFKKVIWETNSWIAYDLISNGYPPWPTLTLIINCLLLNHCSFLSSTLLEHLLVVDPNLSS